MEENKNCAHGKCEKCNDKTAGSCCSHKYRGICLALTIIVVIIVLATVFCLGRFAGSRNDFRDDSETRRFMDRDFQQKGYFNNSGLGDTTVQVLPGSNTNVTTPVVQ